jgi:GT2 family glycosyltransferase
MRLLTQPMDGNDRLLRANERPDVTIVVVSYNTAHLLERLFAAIEAACTTLEAQLIVVDNASHDNSVDIFRSKFPKAELIENRINVGFARANNQAISRARGRYILLLNTDAFLEPDTLRKTVDFMDSHLHCGVLGVKLVGLDGSLQPSCRYFPTPWNLFLQSTGLKWLFPNNQLVDDMSWDHNSVRECDWVTGCYYLVRREVIDSIGLFDSRYFLYFEEVDHCRAVRQAGWKVMYYPFTKVLHIGAESARVGQVLNTSRQVSELQIESQLLYFRKHHGLSGVVIAMLLATLAAVIDAGKSLAVRGDMARVAAIARDASSMLRALINTGLGSRSIR